ncbi:MAG: hypothetical protein IKK61_03055 [Clostridia bacterium]|nr:hypothetical protein [Clostridia bacterium]
MLYPIYNHKRCRRRDQIGMYDDSGCLYAGRKTDEEGRPALEALVGSFTRDGQICTDLYRCCDVGRMKDDGVVYEGGISRGLALKDGTGLVGPAHNLPAVFVPQGEQRQLAAAAALILLREHLPDEARIRRRTQERFSRLEPVLDVFLDIVDFIIDIVT